MSTETQTAPANSTPRIKLDTKSIVRNEVSLDFVDTEVMKGKEKGTPYLAPKVTEENLDTVIAWINRKITANRLGAFIRTLCQGWMGEAESQATDEATGKIDTNRMYEVFQTLAADFSDRGDSIPTLKSEIEELTNQMTALDPDSETFAADFKEFAVEIKKKQVAIAAKKRTPKEETAAA